jgi:hypothetical protein
MTELENNPSDSPELSTDAAPEQEPADTEQPETYDSDESDSDAESAVEDTEEVEVDGEKLALPKTTAEKLKAAMLRQADYTRKTQELAEYRKQSEESFAQREARVAAEQANIQSVAQVMAIDARLQQFANTDWQSLSQSDPVAAFNQNIAYQQLKDARAQVVSQIQQHEAQRALREQEATAKAAQQAQEVLSREIKGWGPEVAKSLREVAKQLGADEKAIASIRDPWIVKALHAQKQLMDLQAKASKAPAAPPAVPVKTITGSRAVAQRDPDKMSPDEFAKWRNANLSKRTRA